jgi:hypothetical protein
MKITRTHAGARQCHGCYAGGIFTLTPLFCIIATPNNDWPHEVKACLLAKELLVWAQKIILDDTFDSSTQHLMPRQASRGDTVSDENT